MHCTDDIDDGIGLPTQSPPSDFEMGAACICKPSPSIIVSFKEVSYSASESDDNITFIIQVSQATGVSFSVEFYTQNSDPLSAKGKRYIITYN